MISSTRMQPAKGNSREMPIPFGIFASTGLPLEGLDPVTVQALFQSQHPEPVGRETLRAKAHGAQAHLGTIGEIDPQDLSQAGWGIIFGASVEKRVKEALQPLIVHRREQVGDDALFRVFENYLSVMPEDTAESWLDRQGVRMDVVDPQLGVPFYLLIVAPPDEIPFEFQYALDLYWGVGRLWFDTAEEFRQYAASVVRYETMARPPTARQSAVFATCHDAATQLFTDQVALPLIHGARGQLGQRQKFSLQPFTGATATKDSLRHIYQGAIPHGPPALLFSGTHGVGFGPDDPRQASAQGAILCQDWRPAAAAQDQHYFAAADLPADAKVHGMIHVLFACYAAGYPRHDNFNRRSLFPKEIASQPNIGRLPQALLSHPDGGALAVLGHVDRAWGFSFQSEQGGPQIQGFRDVLGRMLRGDRLGQATDQFNQRWATLSTELAETLHQMVLGRKVDPYTLANRWIARDDARNYLLLGDPAVCLRVKDMPELAPAAE